MKRKEVKRGIKTLIFGAALAIFAVSCGNSNSYYEAGNQAMKAWDDAIALELYQKGAGEGDVNCLYKFALRFASYEEQQNLIKKAAEKGCADAQLYLGLNYKNDKDEENADKESAYWFEEAFKSYQKDAEKGDTHAQKELARLYYAGFGVEKNEQKCKEWQDKYLENMTKAAENGDIKAQEELAIYYKTASGYFSPDFEKSEYWSKKYVETIKEKAEDGDGYAQVELAIYYNRNGFSAINHKEDIKELYRKAAKNGNKFAKLKVKKYYNEDNE